MFKFALEANASTIGRKEYVAKAGASSVLVYIIVGFCIFICFITRA
jgi:hypothetical protein